jgi:capsular polysaccharide biosynthesis protein
MGDFVCPQCYIQTRPHAFFYSRGETWWSVSPSEQSRYRDHCPHRKTWPNGTILGCPSMRAAIERWLWAAAAPPALFGTGEVSIAGVAAARHLIEARGDCPVQVPPVIADSFRDPEVRANFESNPGSIEINSFDLRDVVLVAAHMLLFRDGQRIAESRYLVAGDEYWMKPPTPRELREISTERTVVIGVNHGFRNYYHWLMQCLPAIDASVTTVGAGNCVLALPRLAGWQEESLALLGYASIPRIPIEFDCHYHFKRAHYCTYLNGSAAFSLSPRCLDVLDRLGAGIGPMEGAPERLYVARLDSPNRVLRNEAEVTDALERNGFVTLVPGFHSLRDQIALFKSAQVVVGAHGAGLTNLAFCRPGTTVLELIQSNYPNACVNRIARGRGLRYHAECFQCVANDDVHGQDWIVDMGQLNAKLPRLLEASEVETTASARG